jgi:hypothetical protein
MPGCCMMMHMGHMLRLTCDRLRLSQHQKYSEATPFVNDLFLLMAFLLYSVRQVNNIFHVFGYKREMTAHTNPHKPPSSPFMHTSQQAQRESLLSMPSACKGYGNPCLQLTVRGWHPVDTTSEIWSRVHNQPDLLSMK